METLSVNLLKTKGNNFGDKFIKWALTIGRMVIILTETIALAAFLYRFILDRQIIDQRDTIKQKAAQIQLYDKNEKEFRNLQDRLQLINKLNNQASDTVIILTDVTNMAPSGIVFNTLSINNNTLHIDANIQSVNAFTDFVNKLKKYSAIKSVSIDKIENKTLSGTIIIGITAKLKTQSGIPIVKTP